MTTLKGRILLTIPSGTQAGRTFRLTGQGMPRMKGDGTGDLYLKVKVVLPDRARGRGARGGEGLPRPRRPARPSGHHLIRHQPPNPETQPDTRTETDTMQLDRFTEKAQEAIVAAQQLAERMQSPVLDAEHLLAALVEPDDGIPAETLRRLGVDLAGFRGELAALLARRAHIQGGTLSLDPRAKRVIERAQEEARRLGDEYTSTEHLLLGTAEAGGEGQQLLERHGAGREAVLGALQTVRGGQRVTSANPEGTYQALEKYGRDLTARPGRASSTRSSAATRRSGASSRCSAGGPRTTRC